MMKTKCSDAMCVSLFTAAVLLMSCASTKNSGAVGAGPQPAGAENLCGNAVRYTIAKTIVTNEGGNEQEDHTAVALTLYPNDGKITMRMLDKDREDAQELKAIRCNLGAGMQSGEALYEIVQSKVQANGNTVIERVNLKVEATKGTVQLSVSAEGRLGGMRMIVGQWELVK